MYGSVSFVEYRSNLHFLWNWFFCRQRLHDLLPQNPDSRPHCELSSRMTETWGSRLPENPTGIVVVSTGTQNETTLSERDGLLYRPPTLLRTEVLPPVNSTPLSVLQLRDTRTWRTGFLTTESQCKLVGVEFVSPVFMLCLILRDDTICPAKH